MDKKTQTINTYNTSAASLAKKFDELGARVNDITEAFDLVKKDNPNVLEIGCGNGRDAGDIIKRTNNYLGIDISEKLIELAGEKVPQAKFEVVDIEEYALPKDLDIIFAFASLIHVPKDRLQKILDEAFENLTDGGVIRLSMKHADSYTEVTKQDEFGTRTYYHYSQKDIEELAHKFTIIKNVLNDLRGQTWIEATLQKRSK